MTDNSAPTLEGYLRFIRYQMRIPQDVLPDNDYWIGASYNLAINLCNPLLAAIPNKNKNYPSYYAIAVYNLAGDRLINFANDADNAPAVEGSNPPLPYFAYARRGFKIDAFVSGIVTSTGDEGTSVSLSVPKWAEELSMMDLDNLKTPWGRRYMSIAMQYGPTIWGIS